MAQDVVQAKGKWPSRIWHSKLRALFLGPLSVAVLITGFISLANWIQLTLQSEKQIWWSDEFWTQFLNNMPLLGVGAFFVTALIGFAGWTHSWYKKREAELREWGEQRDSVLEKRCKECRERISKSFYAGFFALLSSGRIKESFETFENMLVAVENSVPAIRSIIFDFLIESLASLGESGVVKVDASVADYVRNLDLILKDENVDAGATCVVRPYWFMTDAMEKVLQPGRSEGISLAPIIEGKDDYGKAEHLVSFQKKAGTGERVRVLVVDEKMIAEIFLTAYIDKLLFKKDEASCPVCEALKKTCPIHDKNDRENKSETNHDEDIPEVSWFDHQMNRELNVKVSYTYMLSDIKASQEVLGDRLYVNVKGGLKLDIRFTFLNLENGILRFQWGENIVPITSRLVVAPSKPRKKVEIGQQKIIFYFYPSFRQLLVSTDVNAARKRIIDHLTFLSRLTEQHFVKDNVEAIDVPVGSSLRIKNLFGYDQNVDRMRQLLGNMIDEVIRKVTSNSTLLTLYDELVQHYNTNGVPSVAYIVAHDVRHPEYPVRIASWREHWSRIASQIKELT